MNWKMTTDFSAGSSTNLNDANQNGNSYEIKHPSGSTGIQSGRPPFSKLVGDIVQRMIWKLLPVFLLKILANVPKSLGKSWIRFNNSPFFFFSPYLDACSFLLKISEERLRRQYKEKTSLPLSKGLGT